MNLLPQDTSPRAMVKLIPGPLREPAEVMLRHIQHGTFQRSLALMVAGSSAVSAMEVGYEHYRGSYSNPVMYTPVLLSGALTIASLAAVFSRRAAQTWMRYLSFITLADGVIGFGFTSVAWHASPADGACRSSTLSWDHRCLRRCSSARLRIWV